MSFHIAPKLPPRQAVLASQLARLLRIREVLASTDAPILRRDLAATFGISERRIQEDLSILRTAGVR